MYGAILGDIIGSKYEFRKDKHLKYNFPLFSDGCEFTDDTILTIATMDCMLNNDSDYGQYYHKWGNKYNSSYGTSFRRWLKSAYPMPYNSFGNGSGMRVSPVGLYFETEEDVLIHAAKTAECTHDHYEGIKGACAIALAIYMAKNKYSKKEIKNTISKEFSYNLNRKLRKIKSHYRFYEICQLTVPESIICFLESNSWEEAVRNAVWLNGDTDTMACMAGAIAEAYYGVPQEIKDKIYNYLPDEMISVIDRFYNKLK